METSVQESISSLQADERIQALYDSYVNAALTVQAVPTPLVEMLGTIARGELGRFSLYDSVCAVLEACIWTYQTPLSEKLLMVGDNGLLSFFGLDVSGDPGF